MTVIILNYYVRTFHKVSSSIRQTFLQWLAETLQQWLLDNLRSVTFQTWRCKKISNWTNEMFQTSSCYSQRLSLLFHKKLNDSHSIDGAFPITDSFTGPSLQEIIQFFLHWFFSSILCLRKVISLSLGLRAISWSGYNQIYFPGEHFIQT